MTPPRDLGAPKGVQDRTEKREEEKKKKKDQSGCVKTQESPKPSGKKGNNGESYRLAVDMMRREATLGMR
jgi:hypothetical protein